MESKSILTGAVIGVIVGGLIGYTAAPAPDYAPYEDQIASLESQTASLQNEMVQLKYQVSSLQNQLDVKSGDINYLQTELNSQNVTIYELQDEIYILMKTFNITPGTWNAIRSWTGSASKTTEVFYVPSSRIRIKWSLDVNQLSNFTISLFEEGANHSIYSWSSLEDEPEGETYAYIRPGYHYLDFSVDECEYSVTVDVNFTTPFTVVYVAPRKPKFVLGEIVTLKIESSRPHNDSYFEIWDPNGSLIWRTDYLTDWIKSGDYWLVPYYKQLSDEEPMLLENNCTLGTWSWVWNSETMSVSGTFEVIQPPR